MRMSKADLEPADWWVPVYLAHAQGSWLPGDRDKRETGAGGLAVKLHHPQLWAAPTPHLPHPVASWKVCKLILEGDDQRREFYLHAVSL